MKKSTHKLPDDASPKRVEKTETRDRFFAHHRRLARKPPFSKRGEEARSLFAFYLPLNDNINMKLTLQTQLFPNAEQAEMLKDTLKAFNGATSWLAIKAFEIKCLNKVELQKLFYYELREKFNLSAQMAIRAIAQTVEAYKRDKDICPEFREFAAMPYDQRIYSFKGIDKVSLLTLEGRIIVPFVMGKYQTEKFSNAKGQADLCYRERDKKWFLLVTVDVQDGTPIPVTDFIGVDFGIQNLTVTSDGDFESGDEVKRVTQKYSNLQKCLQVKASKQSQSGKRPRGIRRFQNHISKKLRNFKKHTNHVISKTLVKIATDTKRGIGIENLTNIRSRCEKRFRRNKRQIFSSWSFAELRQFLTYKAQLAGILVIAVNPAYTSQTCNSCGHCEKANRKSQSEFLCLKCGIHILADFNASLNIKDRAIVSFAQSSESLALQNTV